MLYYAHHSPQQYNGAAFQKGSKNACSKRRLGNEMNEYNTIPPAFYY
jgi:hypothetical protein